MSVLLYCRNCGGGAPIRQGELYYCRECGARSLVESENCGFEKELRLIAQEQKREYVQNLRRQLYERVHAEYVNSTEIRTICREIRSYLPDDLSARFYEIANGESEAAYAAFLRTVDESEDRVFVKEIVEFTVRSLRLSLVLPLKELVERAFKQIDFAQYRELITRIEEEAALVDSCIYEAYIPRDVFVLYSSRDMERVLELVGVLEGQGLTCFVAMRNLQHGRGAVENYQTLLQTAIDSCASVVLVSSVHSRSVSCDAFRVEMPYIHRTAPDAQKARIEYRIDDLPVPAAVNAFLKIFFRDKEYCTLPEQVAARVMGRLLDVRQTAGSCQLCPVCHGPLAEDTRFCPACGHAVKATGAETGAGAQAAPTLVAPVTETDESDLAQLLREAEELTANREYEQAFTRYRTAAVQGSAEAQYAIGVAYARGYGVEVRHESALEWYRMAAQQGHGAAQLALGDMYANGVAVKVSDETARDWYQRSADGGNAQAMIALGEFYQLGRGVKRDDGAAMALFVRAAETGAPFAQHRLGMEYEVLGAVDDDGELYAKAAKYYRLAANQEYPMALTSLGYCYERSVGVPFDMSIATELYGRAAKLGDAHGAYLLARCYESGNGVQADDAQALAYDRLAANGGDAGAQYALGCRYLAGVGVEKDFSLAASLYRMAAEQDSVEAQCALGDCYFNGTGVPKDYGEAVGWYTRATDAGSAAAKYRLGECYADGYGVERDPVRAVSLLLASAEEGDPSAIDALAVMSHGCAPERLREIYPVMRDAAAQGVASAQSCMGDFYRKGQAGVQKHDFRAFGYYMQAAVKGWTEAQRRVADYYLNGVEGEIAKDPKKALEWYGKAADAGDSAAAFALGKCYYLGVGTERDPSTAETYLLSCSAIGSDAERLHWDRSVKEWTCFHLGTVWLVNGGCLLCENALDGGFYAIEKSRISKFVFTTERLFRHGSIELILTDPPKGCPRRIVVIDKIKHGGDSLWMPILKWALKANGIAFTIV